MPALHVREPDLTQVLAHQGGHRLALQEDVGLEMFGQTRGAA